MRLDELTCSMKLCAYIARMDVIVKWKQILQMGVSTIIISYFTGYNLSIGS
jgi:hypothetical protein